MAPDDANARRDHAAGTDGHVLTHRGHTPLGAAHTTASVHARDLTAAATNHQALRARDGHKPLQRRLRARKERLSGIAIFLQPCLLCGGQEETPVHMHVGCAHSRLLWPHYRQAVREAARHLPPGDKALWVASWRSAGAAWTEVFCSGTVPEGAEAQLCPIARYDPPGGISVDNFLHHMLRLGDFAWELRKYRLEQLLQVPLSAAAWVHRGSPRQRAAASPPPPRPGKDFVASLRVVNGTPECPPQEDRHPYRDLLGGLSKHLQDVLFPPWIIGRGSMTAWEACMVGEEWAREWGWWCAAGCAPETPAQRYAAIPPQGWGPHNEPRPKAQSKTDSKKREHRRGATQHHTRSSTRQTTTRRRAQPANKGSSRGEGRGRGGAEQHSKTSTAQRHTAAPQTTQHTTTPHSPKEHTGARNNTGRAPHTTQQHTKQQGATGSRTTPADTMHSKAAHLAARRYKTSAAQKGAPDHTKQATRDLGSKKQDTAPRITTTAPRGAAAAQNTSTTQHNSAHTKTTAPRHSTKQNIKSDGPGGGTHHAAHRDRAPQDTTVHGQQAQHNTDGEQHRAEPRRTKARGRTHAEQQHKSTKATRQHEEQRRRRGRGGGHKQRTHKGTQRRTAKRRGKRWGPPSSTTQSGTKATHPSAPKAHAWHHNNTSGPTAAGGTGPKDAQSSKESPPSPPRRPKKTNPRKNKNRNKQDTTKEGGRGGGGRQKGTKK